MTQNQPKPDRTRIGRARDIIAYRISQFALRRIATPWYEAMIGGSIQMGLRSAAEESGTWPNTLSYAATALESSADNGDQYAARQIREYLDVHHG